MKKHGCLLAFVPDVVRDFKLNIRSYLLTGYVSTISGDAFFKLESLVGVDFKIPFY